MLPLTDILNQDWVESPVEIFREKNRKHLS